ncbi:MAG: zinc-ribbon domain-containing protein, partial [Rubripirellula sp.]
MIHLACPQCQKHYRLDDALAGRTVQCRECGHSFPVVASVDPSIDGSKQNPENRAV